MVDQQQSVTTERWLYNPQIETIRVWLSLRDGLCLDPFIHEGGLVWTQGQWVRYLSVTAFPLPPLLPNYERSVSKRKCKSFQSKFEFLHFLSFSRPFGTCDSRHATGIHKKILCMVWVSGNVRRSTGQTVHSGRLGILDTGQGTHCPLSAQRAADRSTAEDHPGPPKTA